MRIKEVKEYSNRQRINLTMDDGFESGQKVVLLSEDEYSEIEKKIKLLEKDVEIVKSENKILSSQQNNLTNVIEEVLTPVQEQHQKMIESKDNEIKRLNKELNSLKHKSSQFCIDVMALSILQLLFSNKKKVLVDDFNKSILISKDAEPVTDAKKIV